MAVVKVTVEIEVPDSATEQDITDYVDVEYGECNSMHPHNPCIRGSEVLSASWEDA